MPRWSNKSQQHQIDCHYSLVWWHWGFAVLTITKSVHRKLSVHRKCYKLFIYGYANQLLSYYRCNPLLGPLVGRLIDSSVSQMCVFVNHSSYPRERDYLVRIISNSKFLIFISSFISQLPNFSYLCFFRLPRAILISIFRFVFLFSFFFSGGGGRKLCFCESYS